MIQASVMRKPKTEVVESVDQTSDDHENENPDSDPAGDTSDSRGIPGWEKVYALAKALIETDGLSLSPKRADNIINLFNALNVYDKKAVSAQSCYEKCANTKRSFSLKKSGGRASK